MERLSKIIITILSFCWITHSKGSVVVDWGGITTAKELSLVEPSAFIFIKELELASLISKDEICSGFMKDQIQNIPADFFALFTGKCVKHFGDVCEGLTKYSLPQIVPVTFRFLNADCISLIPLSAFKAIEGFQVGTLSSSVCRAISPEQMESIDILCLDHITADCVSGFSNDVCRILTDQMIEMMSAQSMGGMSSTCYNNTNPKIFSKFNENHFKYLSVDVCAVLSSSTIESIPMAAFSGLSSDCLAYINPQACGGFDEMKFSKISPTSITKLTAECYKLFPSNVLGLASPNQVKEFNDDMCGLLDANAFDCLAANTFGSFTLSCFQQWAGGLCAYLIGKKFSYLSVDIVQNIQPSCAHNLPNSYFTSASTRQIANFKNATCASFETNLPIFQDSDYKKFSYFTSQCVRYFGRFTCGMLPKEGFGNLTALAYDSISAPCISSMLDYSFRNSNAQQLSFLNPEICDQLPVGMLEYIQRESYAGFQKSCIAKWTDDTCSFISGVGLNRITPENFSGFNVSCLSKLSPYAIHHIASQLAHLMPFGWFGGLSATQTKSLTAEFMTGVNCAQALEFKNTCEEFNVDQLSGFETVYCVTTNCWQGIRPEALAHISNNTMMFLPQDICAVMSQDQMRVLDGPELRQLSYDCIGALSIEAIKGLSDSSLSYMSAKQCGSFTTDQLCYMKNILKGSSPECASGFSVNFCKELTSKDVGSLSKKAFKSLSDECIKSLGYEELLDFSIDQVVGVSPEAFATFCTGEFPILHYLQAFRQLPFLVSMQQADALMFYPNCFTKINELFMTGVLKGYIDYSESTNLLSTLFVKDDGFNDVSAREIRRIPKNKIEGIRESHGRNFSAVQLANLPTYFFLNNQPPFLLGIDDARVETIPDIYFGLISSFNFVGVGAIPYLSEDQIKHFSTSIDICVEQAKSFTEQQKKWMLPEIRLHVEQVIIKNIYHCPKQFHSSSSGASSTSSIGSSSSSSGSSDPVISHKFTKVFAAAVLLLLVAASVIIGINHCKSVESEDGALGLPLLTESTQSINSKENPSVLSSDVADKANKLLQYIPPSEMSEEAYKFILAQQHRRHLQMQDKEKLLRDGIPPRLPSVTSIFSETTIATGIQSHPLFSKVKVGKVSQLGSVIAASEGDSGSETESWR